MITGASHDHERRQRPRLPCPDLSVVVRPRGRLVGTAVRALDFNRFGIAVQTTQPLPRDRALFLRLAGRGVRLDNLVAVVHNCVREGEFYRCGIRFRTGSELQMDRLHVEYLLSRLEDTLTAVASLSPS